LMKNSACSLGQSTVEFDETSRVINLTRIISKRLI
jgi:hypothetical protein